MERCIILTDGRSVSIRHEFTPGDAGRIIQFHGDVYAWELNFGPKFEGYVASTVGEFACRYTPSEGRERVWLVSPWGQRDLIGCCALLDVGASGAQFRWFLIDPAYRRLGLGKVLLQEAIEFAKCCSYPRLFLYTSDLLPPAGKLYTKMGFSLVEETPCSDWEVPFIEQKYMMDFS